MAREVVVEVGLISIVHAGMFESMGKSQTLDPSLLSLLVLNDPVDVFYTVVTDRGETTIQPDLESGKTVLIASAPGVDPGRQRRVHPDLLFSADMFGHRYPQLRFETATGKPGPWDTGFALLADGYTWRTDDPGGLLTTTVELPAGCTVAKAVLEGGRVVLTPIGQGEDVQRIELRRAGGTQQIDEGNPWPPG